VAHGGSRGDGDDDDKRKDGARERERTDPLRRHRPDGKEENPAFTAASSPMTLGQNHAFATHAEYRAQLSNENNGCGLLSGH
jgi:hypothetical protein